MLPSKHRINLYKNPCTHTRASFVVSACSSSSGEPIISIYNYCGRAAAAAVQGDAKSVRQHHDTAARVCIKIGERREERAHEQPRQVRLVVIGQIFPKVSHWLESQDRRDFRRKILQRVNHTFLIYPLHADFFKVYVPEIAASSMEAYQFTTATKRMKNCM